MVPEKAVEQVHGGLELVSPVSHFGHAQLHECREIIRRQKAFASVDNLSLCIQEDDAGRPHHAEFLGHGLMVVTHPERNQFFAQPIRHFVRRIRDRIHLPARASFGIEEIQKHQLPFRRSPLQRQIQFLLPWNRLIHLFILLSSQKANAARPGRDPALPSRDAEREGRGLIPAM